MNQWSKNTSHQKHGFGYLAIRKISFLLWFQACQVRPLDFHRLQRHLRDRRVILRHLLQPSSSSPTVSEIQTREREDGINSDTSPVQVSTSVDDRSGKPEEIQANKNLKTNKKETTIERKTRVVILRSRSGSKNSGKIWWMMKFQYREVLTPVFLMKCL